MNFNTYASWKEGSKALGAVKFVGNKENAHAYNEDFAQIGSWMDGSVGYAFPVKKRRIKKPSSKKVESEYVFGRVDTDFEPVKKLSRKSKTGLKTVINPVKPRKGEKTKAFVSRCMSEEKKSFPKVKQRIAVCLSKSRARRNPYLESGADISKISDINRKAASMA